jgi:penicillin-binding protein-related factor A (putative recombinase)
MEHIKNLSIGSSTIGFLFSENGTPTELYLKFLSYLEDIKNNIEKEEIIPNEFQKRGIEHEKYIIDHHAKLMGIKHEEGGTWNHQKIKNSHILYLVTVAKPDAIFVYKGKKIPVEAKHTKINSIEEIPRAHIFQVMFQIMCMEREGKEIPFGHYISAIVDEVSHEVIEPVVWARIYRSNDLIEKMRKLIVLFYHNYVCKSKIPPTNILQDWKFPDVVVEDLFKSSDTGKNINLC